MARTTAICNAHRANAKEELVGLHGLNKQEMSGEDKTSAWLKNHLTLLRVSLIYSQPV
jgi:hypothetical protein